MHYICFIIFIAVINALDIGLYTPTTSNDFNLYMTILRLTKRVIESTSVITVTIREYNGSPLKTVQEDINKFKISYIFIINDDPSAQGGIYNELVLNNQHILFFIVDSNYDECHSNSIINYGNKGIIRYSKNILLILATEIMIDLFPNIVLVYSNTKRNDFLELNKSLSNIFHYPIAIFNYDTEQDKIKNFLRTNNDPYSLYSLLSLQELKTLVAFPGMSSITKDLIYYGHIDNLQNFPINTYSVRTYHIDGAAGGPNVNNYSDYEVFLYLSQ